MSSEESLAAVVSYLRQFRSSDPSWQKPVFWLGAGCSVHDGVPLSSELLRAIVPEDTAGWGSMQYRFDRFCDSLKKGGARAALLEPFFTVALRKDSPYHDLVRLLCAGYSDLVFSFNLDDLMEQAFRAAGLQEGRSYELLRCPELKQEVVLDRVRGLPGPRIRLIKLHGDYSAGFNYMTSSEIVRFESGIETLVREFSSRAAIVCGYSFFHLNVLSAFSREGGALFYVNRAFPDLPAVLSLMAIRSRAPHFVDAPLGCFDTFLYELRTRLAF